MLSSKQQSASRQSSSKEMKSSEIHIVNPLVLLYLRRVMLLPVVMKKRACLG
ncbi:hypothetical protein DYY67_1372 [Candidatus Nitrosotalea sp. TS]|nr:hypothetical protein [Candidatus Nitrosotalea sp. TS]